MSIIGTKEITELDLGIWSSVDDYISFSGNGNKVKKNVFLFRFYKQDYLTIYQSNDRDKGLNMPIIGDTHLLFKGKPESKEEMLIILRQIDVLI